MHWLFLPGLDGTGLLLEPVLEHVPSQFSASLVRYPTHLKGTYDDYVQLAAEAVDRAEQGIVIVAESFSGPVAVRLANSFPEKVKAVVLAASFVSHPVPRWWATLLRLSDLARGHSKGFSWPIQFLLTGFDAPPKLVETVQKVAVTVPAHILLHRLKLVLTADDSELFRGLRLPILALVAARDRLIPKAYLSQMLAFRPDLDLRIFETPHLLLERRSEEAVGCIDRFLVANTLKSETFDQKNAINLPFGRL